MIEQLIIASAGDLLNGRILFHLGPYHPTVYAKKRWLCQINPWTECPPKAFLLSRQFKATLPFKSPEPAVTNSCTVAAGASKFHRRW